VLEQPALLLGQASYAVMAKLVAARDKARFSRLVWQSAGTALLLSIPVLVLLAFFSTPLLGLLGGKSFRGGANLLLFLAFARAIAISAPPFTSALIAMGLPSRSIMVNLLANLLLLPLLPLFLVWFGLDGAGWHAILQSAIATLALAWWFRLSVRQMQ
jgi:O-antigen/teichoic acid export membrane protein